jgi:hypothetical protein
MDPKLQEHVAFHLTGKRVGATLQAPEGLGLRPALLAPYKDLTALRYDFPLVLARTDQPADCIHSLSGVIDHLLQEIAPRGIDGERTRKHVLQLEREIRALVAEGAGGDLSDVWETAAKLLATRGGKDVAQSFAQAQSGLKVDGVLVDCSPEMPARLLTHAWQIVQAAKTRAFKAEIERLILKLGEVLRADFVRSDAGRSAESLRAAVGTVHADDFDFDAFSRVLTKAAPPATLPAGRRERIDAALQALRSQRFFQTAGGAEKPHSFVFESCAAALDAYRRQLPEMVELIKAVTIAELEIEGRYLESHHDLYFEEFDANSLRPQDLGLFPGYLVCTRASGSHARDDAALMEVLALGLPVKVLVQFDDLLEEPAASDGHFAFSARGARLATMALGLNDVYVLQSASSNLYQLRERILKGLQLPGPALFSVFTGASGQAAGLPPYLVAAAAMQSRAFPAFTYDPSAGPDWASRFTLEDNPQPELDWPVANFAYEDEARRSVAEDLPFTYADFVACDPRYASHLAGVPRALWNGSLVHLKESLADHADEFPEKVPYLMMVDRNEALHRVIVDDKLILAAQRCRDMWRSLQELGGIRNSYAARALARERQAWEAEKQREIEALKREARPAAPVTAPAVAPTPATAVAASVVPSPAAAAPQVAPPPIAPEVEEKKSDEAYIETPRCTTCNECTLLNDRMFAYDENKQAYIKDITAGTYRQLVEAAESCQVSIIHPGKPRDPNEPGVDDLLKRAEPFL